MTSCFYARHHRHIYLFHSFIIYTLHSFFLSTRWGGVERRIFLNALQTWPTLNVCLFVFRSFPLGLLVLMNSLRGLHSHLDFFFFYWEAPGYHLDVNALYVPSNSKNNIKKFWSEGAAGSKESSYVSQVSTSSAVWRTRNKLGMGWISDDLKKVFSVSATYGDKVPDGTFSDEGLS